MLILSYSLVFLFSSIFLKKKQKRSVSTLLKAFRFKTVLLGIFFVLLFQLIYYVISFGFGGNVELVHFLNMGGYEAYSIYSSTFSVFILYVIFAVFGAFVEEVTFRGYIQSRISREFNVVLAIIFTSLLFSLQHIHVFQFDWIFQFLQTQFIYILCFGIFVGYLFFKTNSDIWCVLVFHMIMNIFNISLYVEVSYTFPFAPQFVTITSFVILTLILHLSPIEHVFLLHHESENQGS